MAEVTEITLGERKFGIRRLTIGQLLELQAIVSGTQVVTANDEKQPEEARTRRLGQQMLETIAAALARDFPEMTARAISEIEMTSQEFSTAYTVVLQHSGMISSGEAPGNP